MEYSSTTPLSSLIKNKVDKKLNEDEARKIMIQLTAAIQYCHKR